MKSLRFNNLLILYLLFYIFWGWIYRETIFESSLWVYLSFLGMLVLFSINTNPFNFLGKVLQYDASTTLLSLFFLYFSIAYFFQGNIEYASYWLICFLLLLQGYTNKIIEYIPKWFLFFCGVFAATGVLVQIFMPNFYASFVLPLFKSGNVEKWALIEYGYGGFTYQIGVTSDILMTAVLSTMFLSKGLRLFDIKILKYAIVLLLIICVFLTGKRTNSFIVLFVPLLGILMSQKGGVKKIIFLFIMIILFFISLDFVLNNVGYLQDSLLFHRFADTVVNVQYGGDFDSDRFMMWNAAYSLFQDNPLLGIGAGMFKEKTVFGTDVHNSYIQTMCELGMIGLTLYIMAIVTTLFSTINLLKHSNNERIKKLILFSLSIQLVFILEGFTENVTINRNGFMMYAFAVSILLNCKVINKRIIKL